LSSVPKEKQMITDSEVDAFRVDVPVKDGTTMPAHVANAHRPLRAAISFYGGRIAPDLLRFAGEQNAPREAWAMSMELLRHSGILPE
jgi:hypothetical protein